LEELAASFIFRVQFPRSRNLTNCQSTIHRILEGLNHYCHHHHCENLEFCTVTVLLVFGGTSVYHHTRFHYHSSLVHETMKIVLVLYSSWLLDKTDMMSSSPFMYSRSRHRYFCILYITFSSALSVFAIEQRNGKLKMPSDNV